MKRLLTLAFVIATVCLPAFGQQKARAGEDFNELIRRYYTAWSTLNPDNAAPLYAKDADLVFYDIAPLKYSGGWSEYSDTFKKNMAPGFSSLTLTPNRCLSVFRGQPLNSGVGRFVMILLLSRRSTTEFSYTSLRVRLKS